jgi:hypothetical protein
VRSPQSFSLRSPASIEPRERTTSTNLPVAVVLAAVHGREGISKPSTRMARIRRSREAEVRVWKKAERAHAVCSVLQKIVMWEIVLALQSTSA